MYDILNIDKRSFLKKIIDDKLIDWIVEAEFDYVVACDSMDRLYWDDLGIGGTNCEGIELFEEDFLGWEELLDF